MRRFSAVFGIAIMLLTACGGDPVGTENSNIVSNFRATFAFNRTKDHFGSYAQLILSPDGTYTLIGEQWLQICMPPNPDGISSCNSSWHRLFDDSGTYSVDLDGDRLSLGSTSVAFHSPHSSVVWAFGGDLGTLELTR